MPRRKMSKIQREAELYPPGAIVWVNYRKQLWPAVVRRCYKKRDKVTFAFLPLEKQMKTFSAKFARVSIFRPDEQPVVGNDERLREAIRAAEELYRKQEAERKAAETAQGHQEGASSSVAMEVDEPNARAQEALPPESLSQEELRQGALEEGIASQQGVPEESSAIQQQVSKESSAIQQQVSKESSAIQQQVSKESIALQQGVPEEGIATQQQVPKKSEAPQQEVPRKSEAPQQEVPKESKVLQQEVPEESEALQQEVPEESKAPQQKVPEEISALKQQVFEEGIALQQGASKEDIASQQQLSEEDPAVQQQVIQEDIALQELPEEGAAPQHQVFEEGISLQQLEPVEDVGLQLQIFQQVVQPDKELDPHSRIGAEEDAAEKESAALAISVIVRDLKDAELPSRRDSDQPSTSGFVGDRNIEDDIFE